MSKRDPPDFPKRLGKYKDECMVSLESLSMDRESFLTALANLSAQIVNECERVNDKPVVGQVKGNARKEGSGGAWAEATKLPSDKMELLRVAKELRRVHGESLLAGMRGGSSEATIDAGVSLGPRKSGGRNVSVSESVDFSGGKLFG